MTSLSDVYEGRARWAVEHCDCLYGMSALPPDSVDAIVCDGPYGIGFMGREWDTFSPEGTSRRRRSKARKKTKVPKGTKGIPGELSGSDIEYDRSAAGNRRFQEWCTAWAREALRVLKPGGHLIAFGGTRTWHRLVCAIEDVGFEIRDSLAWLYGQGFPKSLDVAKAIDKELGAEPTVVGSRVLTGSAALSTAEKGGTYAANTSSAGRTKEVPVTVPTSEEAKRWEGFGTALKPGFEPIVLARKPLSGTVARTILEHGTGALNIDGCRIATDWNEPDRPESWKRSGHSAKPDAEKIAAPPGDGIELNAKGRFPANVILSHTEECRQVGTKRVAAAGGDIPANGSGALKRSRSVARAGGETDRRGGWVAHGNGDGTETVEAWDCSPECPVRMLDEQSGISRDGTAGKRSGVAHVTLHGLKGREEQWGGYGGEGGASRFFYCSKASTTERNIGLEDDSNDHPTVKALEVIRWCVRLVTSPGALVLDIFVGSGTTGMATMMEGEGRRFIGMDREARYVDIARRRIAGVVGGAFERVEGVTAKPPKREAPAQRSLFEGASP